jgi:titin
VERDTTRYRVSRYLTYALIASTLSFISGVTSLTPAKAVTQTQSGSTITNTYSDPTKVEYFTVPANVTTLNVTLIGAEGGRGGTDSAGRPVAGGYQGYISGTISVTPGQVLSIGVGKGGADSPKATACTAGIEDWTQADSNNAVGGTNPLGGYAGGAGGSPGPDGCSGYGGSGGAASVIYVGTSNNDASIAKIVAGGSGGSGGSGQYSETVGQISLSTYSGRTDTTSTSGQPGEYTSYACYNGILPSSFPGGSGVYPNSKNLLPLRITSDQRCDGGGGAGGGGGAQGGAQGSLQYGAGVARSAPEFFGHGANPGQNSTGGSSGLTAIYQYYSNNNANGSAVISYSSGVPNPPTGVNGTAGSGLVNLYWTAPANTGNSAITGYTVQYATGPSYNSWTNASGCTGTGVSCTISSLTNGTNYEFEVLATNAVGSSVYSAASPVLTPAAVPTAPTSLVATPSDGQLSIAFTAPTSSISISGYDYSLDGGTTWVSSGATTSPVVVTGLTDGTSYSVKLRGNNASGNGTASSTVTSTPYTIPGAPTITNIVSGGDGHSLIVTFTAGYNGGNTITSYQYAISTGANTSNFGSPVTISGTSSPFTITGLSTGTYYTVELRAVNNAGSGPYNIYNNSVTLAAPHAPVLTSVVAGNQTLQVSYTPYTSATNGGSAISGISYSLDGGTTWTSAGTLANPFTISGLSNGTSYSVMLKATNPIGTSPSSNSLSATPVTVPGAPTNVSVTAAPASAIVSWIAPVSNGGSAITGYTATAYTALSGGSAAKTCTTTGALTCTITGLTNDTNYFVTVLATNSPAGNGPEASPRTLVTPAALPGAPTISAITAGSSYLSVAFTAGTADTNNPITSYQYSLNSGSTWVVVNTTTSPITISGLNNGTSYSVILQANSLLGSSPSSGSVSSTPYTFPDQINSGTISYTAGAGAATASWTAPFNEGSQITEYDVSVFNASVGGLQLTSNACTSTGTPAAAHCSITGLTNGTTYWISIQAKNAAGYSNRSDPRVSVVPGTATTTALTSSSASVNYGGSVTLTATVSTGSGTPTGTMNFMADGTSISGCSSQALSSKVATCSASGLTPGVHSITAAYSGDSSYSSSISSPTSLTVNQLSQSITFGSLADHALGSGTFSLSATASSSLSVAFTSATTSVCTVSGTTVTLVTTGTCSINADQSGSSIYTAAATVTQSFTVNPAVPTISTPTISGTAQVASTLSVGTLTTGGVVTATTYQWNRSSNSGGPYTPISGATNSTYVPLASDATYYLTVTVTVSNAGGSAAASSLPTSAVALIPQTGLAISTLSGNVGTSLTLGTTGGNGGGAVTYSTTTSGCTAISGILTVLHPVTCSVTATKAAQGNYASASVTASVVMSKAVSTLALSLPGDSLYANLNKTVTISATSNTPGVVSFTLDGVAISGCTSVATIADVATCSWTPLVAPSTAALAATFSPTNSTDYSSASASLSVQVVGSSLAGVNPSDITKVGTLTTLDNTTTRTIPAASTDTTLLLTVPGGSVPTGTQVEIDLDSNLGSAKSAINSSNYLLNYIVAWNAPDGSVPSPSTPLTLAITNASITKGMAAYVIIGGVATIVGKATTAGSMTISLTQDPLVVVAPTVPDAPTSVTATSGANASSTVSWSAPDNDGGKAISSYTVTASPGGQTCTTASTSCTVTGLSNGTGYVFTVTATNVVGTSAASSQSATATPAAPPVITTPDSGLDGTYNSPYSLGVIATSSAAISSFAITSGASSLSALGLSLNTNSGVISGTPTAAGSATIIVRVTDANSQTASTSAFTITINQATSSFTAFTVPSLTYGAAATLSATTSVPGTVVFIADSAVITGCSSVVENGSNTATCSYTPTGTSTVTFTLNFTPTSSSYSGLKGVSLTLATPSKTTSATTFGASSSTPSFGSAVTLTAHVTSGASGTVVFEDGYANVLCTTGTLSGGTATCSWTPDNVTTYSVTANYAGDSNYLSSQSSAADIVVAGSNLSAPTPITVSSTTTTSITVTFTPVTHADSTTFNLYTAATGGLAVRTITGFTSGQSVSGLSAGTNYYVTLQSIGSGNYLSSDESTPRTLITTLAAATAPAITSQPNDASVLVNQSVSFSVTATKSDGGALSYQWNFNGSPISGATSATYSFTPLSTSSSGSYTVTVTDTFNGTTAITTSNAAALTVLGAVSITAPTMGLTATAGSSYSLSVPAGGGTAPLTFSLQSGSLPSGLTLNTSTGTISGTPSAVGSQTITITVTDKNGNTATSSAFTIVINRASQAALVLSLSPTSAPSTGSAYSQLLTPTLTSSGSGSGALSYAVTSGTASNCALSAVHDSGTITLTADTDGTCLITVTRAADSTYSSATSSAVTFTFTKATQSALVITSTSGSFGSPLTLTTSGGSGTGAVSFSVDTSGCHISGTTLTADLATTCLVTATKAGDTYYASADSSPTSVNIGLSALSTPIVTSVTNDGTRFGLIVAFTGDSSASSFTANVYSAASGGTPIVTLAGFTSGSDITGLNANTTYYIGVVAVGGGSYGDSSESSRVSGMTLAAAIAPIIDTQPTPTAVTVGQYETLTVTAHSADGGTLSYQWNFGGSSLPGATSATYSFLTNSTLNSGNYTVTVTNTKNGSTASVTSNAAVVVVAGALAIATPSAGLGGTIGFPYSLSMNATGGTAPIHYTVTQGLSTLTSFGLSENSSTGVISGTPTETGTVTIAVTATDAAGATATTGAFNLVISDDPDAIVPTFTTPTRTADGFTVTVTNYDAFYTESATVTAGSITNSIPSGSNWLLTITGLSAGQSATVTVTTSKVGYVSQSATVTGTALAAGPSAPPAPPPPPQPYLTLGSYPTIHKVANTIVCTSGSFNYGVHYYDGTPDFYQTNSLMPSLGIAILINGQIQTVLVQNSMATTEVIQISALPSTGQATCQVTATKGGVSMTALSTGNTAGINAASAAQSAAISDARAAYSGTVLANNNQEKSALVANRASWRATSTAARSAFLASGHSSSDAKIESLAIKNAYAQYQKTNQQLAAQLAADNATALATQQSAILAANIAFAQAEESAGYAIALDLITFSAN